MHSYLVGTNDDGDTVVTGPLRLSEAVALLKAEEFIAKLRKRRYANRHILAPSKAEAVQRYEA